MAKNRKKQNRLSVFRVWKEGDSQYTNLWERPVMARSPRCAAGVWAERHQYESVTVYVHDAQNYRDYTKVTKWKVKAIKKYFATEAVIDND